MTARRPLNPLSAPLQTCWTGALVSACLQITAAEAAQGPLPSPVPASCSAQIPDSSSNSLMMANDAGKFECAWEDEHNNASLGPWDTTTWTSSAAAGYWNLANCDGQTGDVDITTASAFTDLGGSISWTASNSSLYTQHWGAAIIWQTQANGGVAGSQFNASCNGASGYMDANFYYIATSTLTAPSASATLGTGVAFTVEVNSPDGLGDPVGNVYLYQQAGSTPDPDTDWILGTSALTPTTSANTSEAIVVTNFAGKNQAGQTNAPVPGTIYVYAAYPGSQFGSNPTSVNKGWLQTQTASLSITLTATGTAPASVAPVASVSLDTGLGAPLKRQPVSLLSDLTPWERSQSRLANRVAWPKTLNAPLTSLERPFEFFCPKGSAPVNIALDSETSGLDSSMNIIKRKGTFGIRIAVPKALKDAEVRVQLLCKDLDQPVIMNGLLGYGTVQGDIMETQQGSLPSTLFGGLGNDLLSARYKGDVVFGGPGDDNIRLSGTDAVGSGGLGNDVIEDTGNGPSLLIGGPGRDHLIGGYGASRINALDGKGHDRISCKSPQNEVLADAGDEIKGPCQRRQLESAP